MRAYKISAFTLIELSIVLVIIGLVIGGILVGRDLITSASLRSQISQIEKYQRAVYTFRSTYGYLPGDIPDPDASRFGFAVRGQYAGEGDGNAVVEDVSSNAPGHNYGVGMDTGEIAAFWMDLSTKKLIEGRYSGNLYVLPCCTISGTTLDTRNPQASLGQGNYIYVWSYAGINYFGISAITQIWSGGGVYSSPALTVAQAYYIDGKIDDGLPLTGLVTARYEDHSGGWIPYAKWAGASSNATSTAGSSATCYDNNNVSGAIQTYSITQNNGSGKNCGLSIRFQ